MISVICQDNLYLTFPPGFFLDTGLALYLSACSGLDRLAWLMVLLLVFLVTESRDDVDSLLMGERVIMLDVLKKPLVLHDDIFVLDTENIENEEIE